MAEQRKLPPASREVEPSRINTSIYVGVQGPLSVTCFYLLFFNFSSNLVCFVSDVLIYIRLSVMCLNYGEEKYSF